MSDANRDAVSRRQWVGMLSAPMLAAVGSNLLIPVVAGAAATEGQDDPKLLGARIYNVRDFGATGDGQTLDTQAVQSAIDACARDHGGTVLVPAGVFVVGTIELKSNVTLHLAAAGKLLGSPEIKHYHSGNGIPRSNGNVVLLSAADADNITIEGRGTIDGNGATFYTGRGDNTGPGQNSSEGYSQRPHLLVMYKCRNVLVRDVFLTASAYHCFRILQCSYVRLEGVRIHNRVNKNNDGFHINSSEYVNIVNCNVQCQDDACALFGSNRFVTVTNCSFSTRWSIFRFGGGSPENIAISNCLIYETYGCPIKMRFGGRNVAQNILFANLVMKDVTGPISIGFDSRRRSSTTAAATQASAAPAPAPAPASGPASQPERGAVRNISFQNIRATVVAKGRQHADLPFESGYREGETRTCITINGAHADDVIEYITLDNVHVTYEGGGTAEEASRAVPEMAGEYFEIGTPPAYGLYARNVHGLTMNNVRLEVQQPDLRPAVVFDRVEDAAVTSLSVHGNPEADATLRMANSHDVLVTAPRLLTDAATFLRVEGGRRDGILIDGGHLSKAKVPLGFADGTDKSSARLRGQA